MNIRDKIGMCADDRLSEIQWGISKIQKFERLLNLLVPVCSHVDYKTGKTCEHRGQPCRLPNFNEEEGMDDMIVWVCTEHMQAEGFCWGCHEFWAGCEDFDFDPHGLCSNCRDDPDLTGDREDEGDEYDEVDWEDVYP